MSRKDDAVIAALLSCATVAEAAKQSGVSEATLWRWMQEPEFKAKYRHARQQVMQHAIGGLQRATTSAVATLERNLGCGSASVEVQAARAILEQSIKSAELDDLMARLDELERLVAAARSGNATGGHHGAT